MKRLNGKALILWILTAILCVTSCAPAFASVGDRVLVHLVSGEDGSWAGNITGVFRTEDGFYVIIDKGSDTVIRRYTDIQGEPEEFALKTFYDENEAETAATPTDMEPADAAAATPTDITPAEEETEESQNMLLFSGDDKEEEDQEDNGLGILFSNGSPDDDEDEEGEAQPEQEYANSYVSAWFCRNNELYGLKSKEVSDEKGNRIVGAVVEHAKLENGTVTLEDSDLPDLNVENMIGGDDYQYLNGFSNVLVMGDYLIGTTWGMDGTTKVLVYDLKNGSCKDMDIGNFGGDVAEGPDGTFLLFQALNWTVDGVQLKVSRVNPEDMSEEEITTLNGLTNYQIAPCYDKEKDILYYISSGQLWAMPQFDPEKAEAVNEYTETWNSKSILLPDGFVLLWSNSDVTVKNTDPTQRTGISLRIRDISGTQAINDAIFEMNNTRGDVSVILQQDYSSLMGDNVLQSMMNQDSETDIYVLEYEGNNFQSMLKRGYLQDLSDVEQIKKDTDRMYPYLQNAMTKDGKIIAIPVRAYAQVLSIEPSLWKKMGGTDEDLPKTWDQFLDWLPTLQERLEANDGRLVDYYLTQSDMRYSLIQNILYMYQMQADRKGETPVFNSPRLKELLKRVHEYDFGALGIPEKYIEPQGDSDVWSKQALLQVNSYFGINNYDYSTPLTLKINEEDDEFIPVCLYAAFINPYTTHPEEAKEMLSLILKNEDLDTQYALFTDKTEPIRDPYYEENKKWQDEYLAELRETLEKAEGEEKAEAEENLRQAEKNVEEMERNNWRMSPLNIELYQKYQQIFMVTENSYLYGLIKGIDDPEGLTIITSLYDYDLASAYEGMDEAEKLPKFEKVSVEEALGMLDKKIQMMHMEGN